MMRFLKALWNFFLGLLGLLVILAVIGFIVSDSPDENTPEKPAAEATAEEKRAVEEKRRAAEERAAEEKRRAAERAAEEELRAAAERAAEEEKKAAEERACRQSLQCWGDRHHLRATSLCVPLVEQSARYAHKWTDG